jgi:hypothetical protein
MRLARWIKKATNTLRMCNIAFPLQQYLRKRALFFALYVHSISCYSYSNLNIYMPAFLQVREENIANLEWVYSTAGRCFCLDSGEQLGVERKSY